MVGGPGYAFDLWGIPTPFEHEDEHEHEDDL